jgi:hypothetical protein
MGYLFNENSALCIFGKGGNTGSTCATMTTPGPMDVLTPEEKEILQRLQAKAQRLNTSSTQQNINQDNVPHTDVYAANMTLLRR